MFVDDEDEDVRIEKTLAQRIVEEIQDEDGEPVKLSDLVHNCDASEEEIMEAIEEWEGVLTLEKKKRGFVARLAAGYEDLLDRGADDGDEAAAGSKEAERRALEFRRVQVQRKVEGFLRQYTHGQNLTKVGAGGKRYHRRVYIDTSKKSLIIQGASGPKLYRFDNMREIDMESKTTKEGRLETHVAIAMEKGGKVFKELTLSFPDQQKANTFVNCLSLFAMALRPT